MDDLLESARRQLSASLLAPYVAAAAQQVADGIPVEQLATPLREALADAHAQLTTELLALQDARITQADMPTAALSGRSGRTTEFATITLETLLDRAAVVDESLAEQRPNRARLLRDLTEQLRCTSEGDRDSAITVLEIYRTVVDRLVGRTGISDIA